MGTMINAIAIIFGGSLGLLLRRGFPERVAQTALQVVGLFTIFVGFTMALQGKEFILVLISLASGAIIGEWIDIEGRLERFGLWLESRFHLTQESPAKGFIHTSLLFCVGSMAIVGSITDGLKGDSSILVTKAMMDGIISIPFAASMGAGVFRLCPAGSALPGEPDASGVETTDLFHPCDDRGTYCRRRGDRHGNRNQYRRTAKSESR